jgi:beta-mannosidase
VAPHGTEAVNVESLLGRFVDVSWSYRFGPPAQNLIVMSLEQPFGGDGARSLLAQSFRFPVDRPSRAESPAGLGLAAGLEAIGEDAARITVSTRRLAYGVRVHVPGFVPDDDAFSVEPGHAREVLLRRDEADAGQPAGYLTALNLTGRVAVRAESP